MTDLPPSIALYIKDHFPDFLPGITRQLLRYDREDREAVMLEVLKESEGSLRKVSDLITARLAVPPVTSTVDPLVELSRDLPHAVAQMVLAQYPTLIAGLRRQLLRYVEVDREAVMLEVLEEGEGSLRKVSELITQRLSRPKAAVAEVAPAPESAPPNPMPASEAAVAPEAVLDPVPASEAEPVPEVTSTLETVAAVVPEVEPDPAPAIDPSPTVTTAHYNPPPMPPLPPPLPSLSPLIPPVVREFTCYSLMPDNELNAILHVVDVALEEYFEANDLAEARSIHQMQTHPIRDLLHIIECSDGNIGMFRKLLGLEPPPDPQSHEARLEAAIENIFPQEKPSVWRILNRYQGPYTLSRRIYLVEQCAARRTLVNLMKELDELLFPAPRVPVEPVQPAPNAPAWLNWLGFKDPRDALMKLTQREREDMQKVYEHRKTNEHYRQILQKAEEHPFVPKDIEWSVNTHSFGPGDRRAALAALNHYQAGDNAHRQMLFNAMLSISYGRLEELQEQVFYQKFGLRTYKVNEKGRGIVYITRLIEPPKAE